MSSVSPIPEGFHSLTAHLIVKNANEAMDFYRRAFDAQEICRFKMPDSELVAHGLLRIGNSMLMVADEFPEGQGCPGWVSPHTNQGTTVALHIYVDDVDAAYQRAVDCGCDANMLPMDAFWGDRYGQVVDPYGHHWSIATHKVEVSEEEINRAAAESLAQYSSG
jgi:uncharacterized glyoxalase superfamily protein PhnB